MNIFQRARRSIIRKPVKSLLLFLVVFVISLFLLSGMASKTASIQTQNKTRQAIGAGFLLEGNEANRHKRLDEAAEKIGEGGGCAQGVHLDRIDTFYGVQWFSWADHSFDTLKIKDIEKIASVAEISDYNITTAVTAVNPINFLRIEDEDVDQSKDIQGVSLIGNRSLRMDLNVLSGNLTIKTGRMTGKEDVDVCVISEDLARLNNLSVGDKLQFNDYHNKETAAIYEAGIVGIYQVQQRMTPCMAGDTYRSENVIFTDLSFPEKAEGSEGDPLYETAYFEVGNVKEYESAKENIKSVSIGWERYNLIDNNGNYDTVSANFNDLEHISEILIWVVAIASFVILFLIFVFWLKNRTLEVGIFLSIGISKFKILGQILIEALVISSIAVVISFLAAPGVSRIAADYLVEQQVRQMEEEKELSAGNLAFDFTESQEEVTGVSVHVTSEMMLFDGLFVVVLTTLSVATSGIIVLMKKPKSILSDMS